MGNRRSGYARRVAPVMRRFLATQAADMWTMSGWNWTFHKLFFLFIMLWHIKHEVMTMMMLISGDILIYVASFSFMVCVCVVTYIFTVFGGWNIMKHHRPGEMSEMVNLQISLTTTVSQRGKNRKLRLFWWNFRKNLHVQAESFPNSNGSERLDRYGRWQNGWVNGRPVFEPQPYPEFDASFSKSLEYRSMYLLDEARSSSFCVDYIVARGATSVNFTVSHWSFKLIALSMHTGKPGRGETKAPKVVYDPDPGLIYYRCHLFYNILLVHSKFGWYFPQWSIIFSFVVCIIYIYIY